MERETTAYQVISQYRADQNNNNNNATRRKGFWAPRFLGHVKEKDGRVVGFLMEHIPGRRLDKNNALESSLCLQALAKLHDVGLVHGGVAPENIIIREGKKGIEAVLVDFAKSVAFEHRSDLLEEMAELRAILNDHERRSPSEGDAQNHSPSSEGHSIG